jgi:hypothetical protein
MSYLDILNAFLALLGLSHITNKFFFISLRIFHIVGHLNQVWELLSISILVFKNLG